MVEKPRGRSLQQRQTAGQHIEPRFDAQLLWDSTSLLLVGYLADSLLSTENCESALVVH